MRRVTGSQTGKKLRLWGLSFEEELAGNDLAVDGTVKYLSLVPWESCNWNCLYCHQRDERKPQELSVSLMRQLMQEARLLGIRSLLLLGGEMVWTPFWEKTKEIIEAADEEGLITVLYSNCEEMDRERAEFLAARRVSVALKIDSLDERKYDYIAHRPGAFQATHRAIGILKQTAIGDTVMETESERMVRLLFTTVGNSLNVGEYVTIARFATNNGARWMMEALNHRGGAYANPELALSAPEHSKAMRLTMALNEEQHHDFSRPCRLLSCITIRNGGEVAVCPQDYEFIGTIQEFGSLSEACRAVMTRVTDAKCHERWDGRCPIKIGPAPQFIDKGKEFTNVY